MDGTGDQLLLTQAAGYVLRVLPEDLDAERFEALLQRGRSELASGEADRASLTLRDALALWRGAALADLAFAPFAQSEIARLEELRLTAVEARIEADLALGRQDSLVSELETLVTAHPYREGLRVQLMLALYRSGRQAEALETYRRARRAFSDELGIEPGPRLQELEGAILRHDPSLEAPGLEAPRARRRGVDRVGPADAATPDARGLGRTLIVVVIAAALLALVSAARDSSGRSAGPWSSWATPSPSSIPQRTRSSARSPSEGDRWGLPSGKASSGSAIATTTHFCGSTRDPWTCTRSDSA